MVNNLKTTTTYQFLILKKIKKQVNSCFTDRIILSLIFQKRRVDRRMFFYYLPFPKVSEKNIYYCGQNSIFDVKLFNFDSYELKIH